MEYATDPTFFGNHFNNTIGQTLFIQKIPNLIPSTFALGDLLLAGGGDGHVLLFDGSKATREVKLMVKPVQVEGCFIDNYIPPRKINACPLKRDHFERRFHLPTMKFSGDLLVFRGVGRTYLRVNLLLIFQRTTES